jgi:hypothetical protein
LYAAYDEKLYQGETLRAEIVMKFSWGKRLSTAKEISHT